MSEIKPCMNTECGNYMTTDSHGCNCNEWAPNYMKHKCPKYRSEPKPEPWQPLNPDEYEPGCTNEGCDYYNHRCRCHCGIWTNPYEKVKHWHLCLTTGCYRPKKKPETVRKLYIEFVVDSSNRLTDDEVLIHASNHLRAPYGNIKRCEIIEEETK